MSAWRAWGRFHMVFDPSPGAFFVRKDEDATKGRQKIPVVSEFFKNEREAVTVGEKELAERAGAVVNGAKSPSYSALSKVGQETYTENEWPDIAASIAEAVTKGTALPKVAKDYGLQLADVKLFA